MPSFFIKSYTVEMGISDHHKPVMSICRTTFEKGESKKFLIVVIIILIVSILRKLWQKKLSETEFYIQSCKTTFSITYEKFALLKQNYLRYNNTLSKKMRKAAMTRSK